MRESIYSVAFVYSLKRIHIEGDVSSDGERNELDDGLRGGAKKELTHDSEDEDSAFKVNILTEE